MKRIVATLVVVFVTAIVAAASSAGALPMPTNDHGMFLNILPAGQGTSTTSAICTRVSWSKTRAAMTEQ